MASVARPLFVGGDRAASPRLYLVRETRVIGLVACYYIINFINFLLYCFWERSFEVIIDF